MLYDKRWDKPDIKADPFSLESLIAWLEKQPAEGEYNYYDNCGCMLHQYFSAVNLPGLDWISGWDIVLKDGSQIRFPRGFWEAATHSPSTFGGALTRAREALAARS